MLGRLSISFACLQVLTASAATRTVCAQGCQSNDLQAAISAAQPGDTIVLKAGEIYKGNFHLPWKEGSDYITIQSSMTNQLPPPGFRVTPAHVRFMATLQQGHRGMPVLAAGANEFEARPADVAGNKMVFDWHLFKTGEAVACRAETMPTPLIQAKVYYVRDVVGYTLRLAETPTGPPVRLTSAGQKIQCSQAGTGHHYRIRGIEMVTTDAGPSEYSLVSMGTGVELNRFSIPHHIEFEQVYIHGRSTRQSLAVDGPRTCLVLNASHVTVRDSYLAECKKAGEESKGIAAWQAPGPLEIRNNYIEGASLNILLGGAAPAIPGHVVGDGGGVLITGNHFTKQLYWKHQTGLGQVGQPSGTCEEGSYALDTASGTLSWCEHDGVAWRWAIYPSCADGEFFRRTDVPAGCENGACWVCQNGLFRRVDGPNRVDGYVVKGVLEAKNLINGLITGNVLERSWSTPVSVPMQVLNPGHNWNHVEDTIFQNNVIRDSSSGYHNGTEGHNRFTKLNRNVRIVNNLFHNIGNTTTPNLRHSSARQLLFQGPCVNCSFEHNTVLSGLPNGFGVMLGGEPLEGFRFANNILHANRYGIFGDGQAAGCPAIEHYAGARSFQNNILINLGSDQLTDGNIGSCAPKTKYVSTKTILFREKGDYRLSTASPYSASCKKCDFTATDGRDLGVDVDEVEAATSGAVAGTPPWAEQLEIKVAPGARAAVITYTPMAGERGCALSLYTNAARTTPHPEAAGMAPARFELSKLKPLTDYWYVLSCRHRRVPGQFRTLAGGGN